MIFEIPQCDSLIELFQPLKCLHSFGKQIILMNLLINTSSHWFIFKSSWAKCHRNSILHIVS